MRLRRVQFSLGRMMIAVAVVAILLATALVLNDRRRSFALLANDYGLKAIEDIKAKRPSRHLELHEKYRYAAHHPWLPVNPDPPTPD
jgi:hypothetical protein